MPEATLPMPTEPSRADGDHVQSPTRNLSIITGLSADLVPTPLYATRRWFFSSPLWYYHLPVATSRISPTPAACALHAGDRFYELIDADIRDLCRLINDAGLRTTPSCEGHFYPGSHFRKVWGELCREEDRINRDGLPVRDSETGEDMLFLDEAYALPWPEFDSFFVEAGASQGAGFLGIVVPPEHPRGDEIIRRIGEAPYRSACTASVFRAAAATVAIQPQPHLDRQLGGRYFGVALQAATPAARDAEWARVTEHLRSVLVD